MGFFSTLAREWRFVSSLARTLWAVRAIDPEGGTLICDDFEAAVDRHGDNTAIIFEGQSLTYRQLEALANRFAAWADAQGIARGQSVAIFLPNRIEYVAAWMGLAKRGIASALINSNLTGAALLHSLSASNAHHVIADESGIGALVHLRAGAPRELRLWSLDAPDPQIAEGARHLDLRTPALAPARPDHSVREAIKAKETALYIYTSGTTGMPKAAKISHVRAQLYMRAFAAASGANARDRLYCALPLYHSTGGLCGVGAALLNGGTLVLRRKFSASQFWDDIAEHDCTIFVYIGELCRYLVNQPPHPKERAHNLRRAFGNGMRPEVWPLFQKRFGVDRILEFYGSTEGNVSLFNFDGRVGAVGRIPWYVSRGFTVKLVRFDIESEQPLRNQAGLCETCAPGEIGEAIGLIRQSARSEFAGYADKAASEKKILRDVFEKGDAWFRTGDLMRQDKDGYFYFVDRVGDTFRWKGENVSTTEVAEAIARYHGVLEVNVYGVAVEGASGRAGMAAITAGDDFELAGLRVHLARELPAFARPLFIRMQPAIETTGTMKYRKVDLVREGFDPHKIEAPLYFDHAEQGGYVRIDDGLHAKIQTGAFRL